MLAAVVDDSSVTVFYLIDAAAILGVALAIHLKERAMRGPDDQPETD